MSGSRRPCYCYNCDTWFGSKGIATHRAMHRRRKELVTIQLSSGTYSYDYREKGTP